MLNNFFEKNGLTNLKKRAILIALIKTGIIIKCHPADRINH